MIYAKTIKTPANTSFDNAIKTILSVAKGLVWRIEIEFPPGCSGLMYVYISDGLYQLCPATPGAAFHSDSSLIGLDDLYLKSSGPFEFVITTWNLDETWDHTIQIRLCMASSESFMSRYMPSLAWDNYSKMLAIAQADQDEIIEAQKQALIDQITDL